MKPSTREWVKKAEEDFEAAKSLSRKRSRPLWNIVAFHAQQRVEKYLKARLEEAGIAIPKTHDLIFLLALTSPVEPLWAAFQQSFSRLAAFAVEARYPGNSVTAAEARMGMATCKDFRKQARVSLGLT